MWISVLFVNLLKIRKYFRHWTVAKMLNSIQTIVRECKQQTSLLRMQWVFFLLKIYVFLAPRFWFVSKKILGKLFYSFRSSRTFYTKSIFLFHFQFNVWNYIQKNLVNNTRSLAVFTIFFLNVCLDKFTTFFVVYAILFCYMNELNFSPNRFSKKIMSWLDQTFPQDIGEWPALKQNFSCE